MQTSFDDDDIVYKFELTYENIKDMAEGVPIIKDGMFDGLYTYLYKLAEIWIYRHIETEQPSEED